MQSGNTYLLTKEQIESGVQVIKRNVIGFFNDARILANNRGETAHCLGLYLFGVEEFGKLLLLQDSLTANPICGYYLVDMSLFGKGSDSKKRAKAHNEKFTRALQKLPPECGSASKSLTVRTPLSKPATFMSGTGPIPNVGTVTINIDQTGTFSDPLAPSFPFTVAERVKGFLIDWDGKQWISYELETEAGRVQVSVAPSDLVTLIDKAQVFIDSYF